MDINVNKTIPSVISSPAIGKSLPQVDGEKLVLLPVPTKPPVIEELQTRDVEPASLSEETLAKLNEVLKERARELEFSVDDTSGRTIVRVIHSESGEVIRQMPPEVVLRFAEAFTKGAASLVEDFA